MTAAPSTTYQNILTSIENGVFILTINRPDKLNALNKNTVQEIGHAIEHAIHTPEAKAIILTGAGTKSFVAGADIAEFNGLTPLEGSQLAQAGQDVFRKIEISPKPVIAAVNGFALGGGCELAMACHLRVASTNARFGQPEVNLGLIAGYGGTQRLTQLIGKARSMEMHLTADVITADQALQFGLVNYVVPIEGLVPKCLEIIEKIKSKAPLAISSAIASINAYYDLGPKGFATEIEEFGKCFATNDLKEGTAAFLEKRKANFTGH